MRSALTMSLLATSRMLISRTILPSNFSLMNNCTKKTCPYLYKLKGYITINENYMAMIMLYGNHNWVNNLGSSRCCRILIGLFWLWTKCRLSNDNIMTWNAFMPVNTLKRQDIQKPEIYKSQIKRGKSRGLLRSLCFVFSQSVYITCVLFKVSRFQTLLIQLHEGVSWLKCLL